MSGQAAGQKTFLVACATGYEIRNWLQGDFYQAAKENPLVRLVILVPPDRVDSCREFQHERCMIEPFDLQLEKQTFKKIYRIACFGCVPTRTIWSRNLFSYLHGGNFFNLIFKQFFWVLGHVRIWRAFMRLLERYVFWDDQIWKPYFEKYKPDAVFGTGILNDEDITLLKYAKRSGVPTLGMMRGWDNFTSKGFLRIFPDKLLVQNPTMIEEAVTLNNFPRARVRAIGFAQWDHYLDSSWHMSKEEFAREFSLDATKRWIVYFGGGLMTGLFGIPDKGDHVLMLDKAIKSGELENSTVLIRVHPGHEDVMKPEARVFPILNFAKGWKFTGGDMKILLNLVRLSDVTINLGSTMSLEAAIFDKPVVLIAFNGGEGKKVPWHNRLSVALDQSVAFVYVQNTGGVWRVSNEQEFIQAVKTYLESPSLHKEGRSRIVQQLVGPLGSAGKSALDELLALA